MQALRRSRDPEPVRGWVAHSSDRVIIVPSGTVHIANAQSALNDRLQPNSLASSAYTSGSVSSRDRRPCRLGFHPQWQKGSPIPMEHLRGSPEIDCPIWVPASCPHPSGEAVSQYTVYCQKGYDAIVQGETYIECHLQFSFKLVKHETGHFIAGHVSITST